MLKNALDVARLSVEYGTRFKLFFPHIITPNWLLLVHFGWCTLQVVSIQLWMASNPSSQTHSICTTRHMSSSVHLSPFLSLWNKQCADSAANNTLSCILSRACEVLNWNTCSLMSHVKNIIMNVMLSRIIRILLLKCIQSDEHDPTYAPPSMPLLFYLFVLSKSNNIMDVRVHCAPTFDYN